MNRRRWIRNVAGTTLLLMMTPNHFNRLFGAENSVKMVKLKHAVSVTLVLPG